MTPPDTAVSRRGLIAASLGSWLVLGSQARASAATPGGLRVGMIGLPPETAGALTGESADVLSQLGISVTHMWAADRSQAAHYAEQAGIPNVVDRPSEMAGELDGALVCDPRILAWQPQIVAPLLKAGTPVWVDGALAGSMAQARTIVQAAQEGKTAVAAATVEEFLPVTTLLSETAIELAPITVGMALVSTADRLGGRWTGVEGVNLACAIFGTGASKVCRIVLSTTEPNYAIALEYDTLKGAGPLNIAVQGLPGGADRVWARLYGTDMVDRAHILSNSPGQEWLNSFLPAALMMQKMFSTRTPPQDYEYLLAKTRIYLAACKSTLDPAGRQTAVSELADDWTLENSEPGYIPAGLRG